MALLTEAYTEEDLGDGNSRIVLKLKKHIAPIKVAVIPLAKNNDKIVAKCHEIKNSLQSLGIGRIKYEDTGNVGKAYRRNDEVEGNEETITVRNRDTMEQERISVGDLKKYVVNYFLED